MITRGVYKYFSGFSGFGEVYKNFSDMVYINTSSALERYCKMYIIIYINTSPAPEKCINTSPAQYLSTLLRLLRCRNRHGLYSNFWTLESMATAVTMDSRVLHTRVELTLKHTTPG